MTAMCSWPAYDVYMVHGSVPLHVYVCIVQAEVLIQLHSPPWLNGVAVW